jgi:hypothetical protein
MRHSIIILLTLILSSSAFAHTLDSEHSLVESLWHQLIGGHHLPLTLALLGGAFILLVIIRRQVTKHREG